MKKLIALVACVALIVCSAVPAFAGAMGADLGEVPWVATAPKVDGVMDAVYAEAAFLVVDTLDEDCLDTGLVAKCYFCWNGDYLYAFYDVQDYDVMPVPAERSSSPWDYDNVEFFIDYAGDGVSNRLEGVDTNDLDQCIQYRIDSSGYPSVYYFDAAGDDYGAYGLDGNSIGASMGAAGEYADDHFYFASNFASDRYTVEFALPLTNTLIPWGTETIEVGDVFGIGIQVTDKFAGGSDTSRYRVDGMEGWAWSAHLWPNYTLGAPDGYVAPADPEPAPAPADPEPAPAPAPADPEPAPAPAPAPTPSAPVVNAPTSDVTAIFSVLASLSAVAGLAISKRK